MYVIYIFNQDNIMRTRTFQYVGLRSSATAEQTANRPKNRRYLYMRRNILIILYDFPLRV